MENLLIINDIKNLYPNEWVLLGNPTMDESRIDVISGIPFFMVKIKKKCVILVEIKLHNLIK